MPICITQMLDKTGPTWLYAQCLLPAATRVKGRGEQAADSAACKIPYLSRAGKWVLFSLQEKENPLYVTEGSSEK